ncbi:MAG: hypothetical protein K2X47_08300 [Bdellovibrionales bacterium]|nr:hypothetical protein [Bdellovibrionales bacterium]
MKKRSVLCLIASVALTTSSVGFAGQNSATRVPSPQVKMKFATVISYVLGILPELPQVHVWVGRTATRSACLVTHSSGNVTTDFEVVSIGPDGRVDREPIGYELSTRRKYDSLGVDVQGAALNLTSVQSLGVSARVVYDLRLTKNLRGLNSIAIAYQNVLPIARSVSGDAFECKNLVSIVSMTPQKLSEMAETARALFERAQRGEKLGAYLKDIVPRCEVQSATEFSCDYAFQSQRIPDYLKVTYALTSKGLGKVLNIDLIRGH